MQRCWWLRRSLVADQDGMVGPRRAQRLARHLPTCPACQRACLDLQRVTRLLQTLPGPARPAAYWPDARRQLQAKLPPRPPAPSRAGWVDDLRGAAAHPAPALVSVALIGMALVGTVTFLGLEDAALIFLTAYLLPIMRP